MLKRVLAVLCAAILILNISGTLFVFAADRGFDAACISVRARNKKPADIYTLSELPQYHIRIINPESFAQTVDLSFCAEDESGNVVWTKNDSARAIKPNSENSFTESPVISKPGEYVFKTKLSGAFGEINKSNSFSAIRESRYSDDYSSVQFHLDLPDYGENVSANIYLAEAAGFGTVRDDLRWSAVETVAGKYTIPEFREKQINEILQSGRRVVLTLGFNNSLYSDNTSAFPTGDAVKAYAAFCGYVADHFKGRVEEFEIWNEPESANTVDGTRTTGGQYATLLRAAYNAITTANPKARVIAGASCNISSRITRNYINELFAEQDLGNYMDALSIHPYEYWDMCMPDENTANSTLNYLDTLILPGLAGWGKPDMPIWFTEYGVPSCAEDYFEQELSKYYTEEIQAIQLVRALVQFKSRSEIKVASVYNLRDLRTNNVFGLVDVDYGLKPAYIALTNLNDKLSFVTPVNSYADSVYSGRKMSCYEFERAVDACSEDIFVMWEHTNKAAVVKVVTDEKMDAPVYTENESGAEIRVPDTAEVQIYDMLGDEIAFEAGMNIELSGKPIYITVREKLGVTVEAEGNCFKITGMAPKPDAIMTFTAVDETQGGVVSAAVQTVAKDDGSFEFNVELLENHTYSFFIFNGNEKAEVYSNASGIRLDTSFYINGQSAENLDRLKTGDTLKIKIDICDCDKEVSKLRFFGVLHSGISMYELKASPVIAKTDNTAEAEITVNIVDESMVKAVKLFVWDNNMQPVSDSVEIQR